MRPGNVTAAGILLICGSVWSMLVAGAIAASTLFIWFPSYCFCLPLALFALVIGILLVANARIGRVMAILGAVAEILQLMDCDMMGTACGIVALVLVSQPDSTAYLDGVDTGDPGYAGPVPIPRKPPMSPAAYATGPGILLHSSFFPLALLLYLTRPIVVANGEEYRVSWGRQFLPLLPGRYDLYLYTPYLTRAGEAQITVDVYEGHVTPVSYSVPFIVFMAGQALVGPAEPLVAAEAPPAAPYPPQAPPPQTPPPAGPSAV